MKTNLEFKLTTRFNPENLSRKLRKVWLSTCHRYRIMWRKQFMGVDLLPRYFASRLNKRDSDGETFWDFALDSERRPYKTFKRAYQACCKAAGIVLEEETKPKRRRRSSKGNLQTAPQGAVRGSQSELEERPVGPMSPPKKRGRPPGSKNKVTVAQELQPKRSRGRPKGSKNKVLNG